MWVHARSIDIFAKVMPCLIPHTVSFAIPSAIPVPYHIFITYVLPPPHSDTSIY